MRIPHYFALGAPGVLITTASAPASYPIESPPAPCDVKEIDRRPVRDDQPGDGQQLSLPWQLIVYLIFMLAVIASRFIDLYTSAIPGAILLDWKYLLFAAIISIAAFPVVYDKALATKNAPYLVQVALVFTTGLGWEKVLSTVAFFAKR